MGRMYTFPFSITAHAAQIDYLELLTITEKPVLIHAFELGQLTEIGDAQEEQLQIIGKRITGAPTSGSSGSSAAAGAALTPNDTGGSATIEAGNTTKLTGGTSVELFRFTWNVRSNYLWMPPPEGRIVIAGATRFVLEEGTTPTDSITGPAGWLLYEELV